MREMLLIGRGGEGVVLASQLLADALARAGLHVQSFPEFKAERRGAPISAFLRWDERPIRRRYKLRECDVLGVVSPGPPSAAALDTVRPGGLVVLNLETRFPHSGSWTVVRVPASRIAREAGVLSAEGRAMANTAVLGACIRKILPDGLPLLEEAIAARMGALAPANIAAARGGFERSVQQHALAGDRPVPGGPPPAPRPSILRFPVSTQDSRVVHTGTWSLDRPLVLDACTGCALCMLFCPEGAIARRDDRIAIDYLYCKGCGICEVVCPVHGALVMEEIHA
jgi:pyruvate ferredoxin oxidoreductase gamma subunit